MKKVLFISHRAYNYFEKYLGNTKQIVDYFDIEVQKILPVLNYKYKNNPEIVSCANVSETVCKYFDLDNYTYIELYDPSKSNTCICVLYECH